MRLRRQLETARALDPPGLVRWLTLDHRRAPRTTLKSLSPGYDTPGTHSLLQWNAHLRRAGCRRAVTVTAPLPPPAEASPVHCRCGSGEPGVAAASLRWASCNSSQASGAQRPPAARGRGCACPGSTCGTVRQGNSVAAVWHATARGDGCGSYRLGLDTSGDEPRDEPSAGDRRLGVECGGTSGERRVC